MSYRHPHGLLFAAIGEVLGWLWKGCRAAWHWCKVQLKIAG